MNVKIVGAAPAAHEEIPVRSVERAVEILLSFSLNEPVLDVPALRERTGLSRPTLYRLLRTLEAKGLIYSFGSPLRFQLGPRFGRLVDSWNPTPALVDVAAHTLNRLSSRTEQTVALMVPCSPTHRRCVFEQKNLRSLSYSRGTGYAVPLYSGASGKVLLAHMSVEQRRAALAPASPCLRQQVLLALDHVLMDGVLVTQAELIAGSVAVAAPVLDGSKSAVAAVCVFGSALRLRGSSLRDCRWEVMDSAQQISKLLRRGEPSDGFSSV